MYGKIFRSIYNGSLCGQWEAIVTFQQFIVLSDPEGFVDMTAEAISHTTSIPLDIIKKGIQILESPDPDSRNPTENGRRLIKLREKFGWKIVNYEHYCKISKESHRRDYMKRYMRDYRKS